VGQTAFISGPGVFTRFTLTATDLGTGQPVPLVEAAAAGTPAAAGAVHGLRPGQGVRLFHRFDASYSAVSGYVPALDLFDAFMGPKTTAYSSYSYGYYFDNLPPRLDVNTGLAIAQGDTQTIGSSRLHAIDLDGSAAEIVYTIASPSGNVHTGTLRRNGTELGAGGTFTQQDVDAGLLTYTHDDSCDTSDNFVFGAVDAQGGVMSDQGFTNFNFNIAITLENLPPTALDGMLNVGLGGAPASSTLAASNADCIAPTYTFAIVSPPTKGSLTAFNPATGAYTYAADPGQTGADSFTYRVNDGTHDSTPATISITIQNQPPVVDPQAVTATEDTPASGTLTATDPDLPAQAITFRVGTDGTRGTANVSGTGFTYTPAPDRFGNDSFTVIANDGTVDSAPATITVKIRPVVKLGRTLVSNDGADGARRGVLMVDPDTADFGEVALGGVPEGVRGVTHGPSGVVVVSAGDLKLYRVDGGAPVALGDLDPSPPFGPVGITTDKDGNLLVGEVTSGVGRYSPTGAPLPGYGGGLLGAVVGVTIAPTGDLYVTDVSALIGGNNKVVKITPTGGQELVASGGLLNAGALVDLARAPNGDLYVAQGLVGAAAILKVTAQGAVSPLAGGGFITAPAGITFGRGGELVVAEADGQLIKVDPTTGAQTLFLADVPFTAPGGIQRVESLAPSDLIFADGFETTP
jgi:hypothetical protein